MATVCEDVFMCLQTVNEKCVNTIYKNYAFQNVFFLYIFVLICKFIYVYSLGIRQKYVAPADKQTYIHVHTWFVHRISRSLGHGRT